MPSETRQGGKTPGTFRVLVVDDSPAIRRHVVQKLAPMSFDITEASSGEEALELTLEKTFDLVVSDIEMDAITGVQLCRVFRGDPGMKDVAFVLLTAAKETKTRFWGRNAGADVYLAKEHMDEKLLPAVQELMKGRTPRDSIRPELTGTPLERVSAVLDHHLFDVVVQSEVRRLMDHVHDRIEFGDKVLELAAEVIGCPYLVLQLLGPGGPTYSIRARGPWPEGESTAGLAALAIPEKSIGATHTTVEADPKFGTGHNVVGGRSFTCEIRVRDEPLGALQVFGGPSCCAETDVRSVKLIAEALGVVVKSLFLVEETQLLALTDGLTGLYNRRHASKRLEDEIARARRNSTGLCVAMCDVDHFKAINDEFGHSAGDHVLQQIANSLTEYVRRNDIVSRWGGEEFLVIFSEIKLTAARIVAERLRGRLASTPQVEGGPEQISVSIGLAMLQKGVTADALIEQADQALYRAKARGRNRVEVAGEERRNMPSTVMEKQDGGRRKPADPKRADAKQADTK
jgi:two-component system cell cycle response regulator